jgi:hypothetical protein
MKKFFYLIVLSLFLVFSVSAQIAPVHFFGVKYYPEGNAIIYFHLNGIDCQEEAEFIQTKMKSVNNVNRFYVNKTDIEGMYWCMLDINRTTSEQEIQDLIDGFIEEFGERCNPPEKACKQVQLPEDFPKYIDTGNPEQDRANYRKAKNAWIATHPEEYKKLNNGSNTPENLKQRKLEEKALKGY